MTEEDYEEEIEHIASLFMQKMKEEQYSKKLFPELRRLKTPTDKLVYQFIMFTGASSYTHIKKGLSLGSHGLSDSLNRMKELGVIYQIEDDRYELTARNRLNEELEDYKALSLALLTHGEHGGYQAHVLEKGREFVILKSGKKIEIPHKPIDISEAIARTEKMHRYVSEWNKRGFVDDGQFKAFEAYLQKEIQDFKKMKEAGIKEV